LDNFAIIPKTCPHMMSNSGRDMDNDGEEDNMNKGFGLEEGVRLIIFKVFGK
jgi:hypothetical protein